MRERQVSIKEICNFIFDLESNFSLHTWKEERVFVWPLIRFKIYYLLTKSLGVFDDAHPDKRSLPEKIALLFKALKIILFQNNKVKNKQKEYLVIPHERKVNGVDIYSDQLIKQLGSNTHVFDSIDGATSCSSYGSFDAYKAWVLLLVKARSVFVNSKTKIPKLLLIEEEILSKFNLKLDLHPTYKEETQKFILIKKYTKRILNDLKLKKLFIVGAYFRQAMVAAAQELDVPVVELQHGVITKYHLGYSYPGKPEVAYFPNEIWGFGRYWFESTELPQATITKVIGAPYIHKLASKVLGSEQNDKTILFTSQGVIGTSLFKIAHESARLMSNYHITFRLHPSENLIQYKEMYKGLESLSNFSISHKQPNIFALIAKHEFQVGVFSTTLFEGFVLGTKTVLVDLPGVEYMESLIETKRIPCISKASELKEVLSKLAPIKDTEDYYANEVENLDI